MLQGPSSLLDNLDDVLVVNNVGQANPLWRKLGAGALSNKKDNSVWTTRTAPTIVVNHVAAAEAFVDEDHGQGIELD